MKKLLLFLCLISVFILTGCDKREVLSVTIGDEKYYKSYLYEFEDADIDYEYRNYSGKNEIEPTENGFCFDNKERKIGDNIELWKSVAFQKKKDLDSYSVADLGTYANIANIIKEYPIKIDKTRDTYIITYYDVPTTAFLTKEEAFEKVFSHTIEVVKENVIIEYEE